MFKKRYMQNIINVIAFVICLTIFFVGSGIVNSLKSTKVNLKANIETEWRQQAKRTLSNLEAQFMYDMNNGTVDPSNELSLQLWAKRNISGVLNGGNTGDAFMINLGNEKFIWDGSPDCAKPEFITSGRYMKDETDMHVDPAQAKITLDKMRLAQSTLTTLDNNWWNFDGSPEFLEWIVIPPGSLGFNAEPITVGGVPNQKYSKLLIALGTQQDEVQSTFTKNFETIDKTIEQTQLFVSMSVAVCIFNLIIYVYLNKKV
jgi:hypothetical protein